MNTIKRRLLPFLLALCLCITTAFVAPVTASAEDVVIEKILTTTSNSPVVMMDRSVVTAATSTTGCTLSSFTIYDENGAAFSGPFTAQNYTLELVLTANEGYVFSSSLRAYLNNSQIDYTLDAACKTATLRRVVTALLWPPNIIKHPGGETVTEGEWASFVSTATYSESCYWSVVSPDGSKVIKCSEIYTEFPNVTVADDGAGKIVVHNIPLEMDGWSVRATFKGPGGEKNSNGAKITVKPDPNKTPEPSPEPTPEPTPEATPEPTPEPTPAPEASETPAEETHEHKGGNVWFKDESGHWLECECGEKTDYEGHSFQWTELRAATKKQQGEEQGVCTICGFMLSRSIDYAGSAQHNSGTLMLLIAAVFLVVIAILVVVEISNSRKRRRRRKKRKGGRH